MLETWLSVTAQVNSGRCIFHWNSLCLSYLSQKKFMQLHSVTNFRHFSLNHYYCLPQRTHLFIHTFFTLCLLLPYFIVMEMHFYINNFILKKKLKSYSSLGKKGNITTFFTSNFVVLNDEIIPFYSKHL